MRIFGKVRHRPSASWRQATDRAFTLIGDGRYEDAGALLTRAADLEPWLSESWFNLALLHKFRHDWEQARAAGLRAVALLDRESGAPGLVERRASPPPRCRTGRWPAGPGRRTGCGCPARAHARPSEPTGHGAGQRRGAALARGRGRGRVGPPARPGPDRGAVHPAALLRAPLGRGRAARRRPARRADHGGRARRTRSSTRSSCGRPPPSPPGWCSWRPPPRTTGTPWSGWPPTPGSPPRTGPPPCGCCAGRAPRAGCRATRATASTWTRTTTASRATPGPLGHRTRRAPCGCRSASAASRRPPALVRGLLDGWVADSPDTREWRDLEEVC